MDASAGVPFSLPNQVSLRSNEDKNYSVALSSQWNGQGLERPRVGGHRDLHTPHPPPMSYMHPIPASLWGSWKPSRPPGPARRLLASGWRGSGRGVIGRPESGSPVLPLNFSACRLSRGAAGLANWQVRQVRAKGRHSARLLGCPAAAVSV